MFLQKRRYRHGGIYALRDRGACGCVHGLPVWLLFGRGRARALGAHLCGCAASLGSRDERGAARFLEKARRDGPAADLGKFRGAALRDGDSFRWWGLRYQAWHAVVRRCRLRPCGGRRLVLFVGVRRRPCGVLGRSGLTVISEDALGRAAYRGGDAGGVRRTCHRARFGALACPRHALRGKPCSRAGEIGVHEGVARDRLRGPRRVGA